MRSFFLAGLPGFVWVLSWWGPRWFRLSFALLSPFGSVAAIVLVYMSIPPGSCEHGCVMGWAANVDSSQGLADSQMTFPVAVVDEFEKLLACSEQSRSMGLKPSSMLETSSAAWDRRAMAAVAGLAA